MKIEHATRDSKLETRNVQPTTCDGQPEIRMIFLLLFLVSFILSCAAPEPVHPPEISEIEWDTKTPQQVLEHLRQNQENITDLTAVFSLSVDPPPDGQPSQMRGVLFFAKKPEGPCVRIKGLGPFGRILFDLVQEGKTLQIYVPSRKTLYHGQTDLQSKKKNIWGDTLRTMFSDLSGVGVSDGAALSFKEGMVIVPLEDGKLMIDRRNGFIRERHDQERVIVYDHYDQKPGLPAIPSHIEVKTMDSAIHAVCELSQIRVNSTLSDAFDLSGYNPENVRDLKELDVKNGD